MEVLSPRSKRLPAPVFALAMTAAFSSATRAAAALDFVRPSDDGRSFVAAGSGQPVQLWGVNYDHDANHKLLEDYWHEDWTRVEGDFGEIRSLNANCARIHLQFGKFMRTASEPDATNLAHLARLIALAEKHELYLLLTGLGCYHKQDVPAWYDTLNERDRWQAQARFWQEIAAVGKGSPAVFAYDLMNEPVLPGDKVESDWLAPPMGDKHFVQRISLDLAGRSREAVAQAWVATLADAIRQVDKRHMLTVGVIPWAYHFPGAQPLFYSAQVGGPLDFVSVHFYPKRGEVDQALDALQVYEVGKPLVIEEIYPLEAGGEEVLQFVDRSKPFTDGWVSFYWGQTIDQCAARGDLGGALQAAWLKQFRDQSPLSDSTAAPPGKGASTPPAR
jgi:hypothetical protein